MAWTSDEQMMPMCFCCPLPTGLHFINFYMFFICFIDTYVENAFRSANMMTGSALGIPHNGEIAILWVYSGATAFLGSSAILMPPSKKKGLFIKIWRAMLAGFFLIWIARLYVNVTELDKWAWEREEENRRQAVTGEKSFFHEKLFKIIESAIRFYVYEHLPFPQNVAYWSIRHWGALVYYTVIFPIAVLAMSFSFIATFLRVTEDGEMEIIAGLVKRRDIRKQRQQERAALLTSQPQSPLSNN